ncbi:unnamed protein product [Spirodela intermedia]|uniref:WRC domain-containing protein n=1 Tax=Spirodela intermedia TaxID=51605 RepID=A0A7I8ICY5_SPIIN|nr:unnamed protein product [Spirodela intermedia]CAA6655481.1 unnamed protein product [Spirodela intermedia]
MPLLDGSAKYQTPLEAPLEVRLMSGAVGAGGGSAGERGGARRPTWPSPKGDEESRRGEEEEKKNTVAICKKGDGKGWQCKREAQWGYSLCQYHLEKLRSYSCYSQRKKPRAASASEKPPTAGGAVRRQRTPPQTRNKRQRPADPLPDKALGISDSFYYYSGFGPLWRKRRGGRPEDGATAAKDEEEEEPAGGEEDEDEEEEGGEEEEEEECEEPRGGNGKPMKSRPLSSIL